MRAWGLHAIHVGVIGTAFNVWRVLNTFVVEVFSPVITFRLLVVCQEQHSAALRCEVVSGPVRDIGIED